MQCSTARLACILKDLLSSETLSINAKFQQPHVEQNFVNMFILTNNRWAIQAGMHARRFFVLEPRDTPSRASRRLRRASTLTGC